MSEVKRYTHDWRNQEMAYDEDGEFVYFEDYEHLKTKLELTNKELGLNIKSHLNDICTLEKLKAQLEKEETQKHEIIKYCMKHDKFQFMWAATILSIIFDCDFRDASDKAREYFKEKEQV